MMPIVDQPQLELEAWAISRAGLRREGGVDANDSRIDQLIGYLRGRGWVKRHVIAIALGWDDRTMREIKASSGGLIISNSQRGYRLTLEANAEEVTHAVNELRSRAKELTQYTLDIEHVWHARRAA